jgi:hypothetical protein
MDEKQSDEFIEITFNKTADSQTLILKNLPKEWGNCFPPPKRNK